jgi:hypothetical protein
VRARKAEAAARRADQHQRALLLRADAFLNHAAGALLDGANGAREALLRMLWPPARRSLHRPGRGGRWAGCRGAESPRGGIFVVRAYVHTNLAEHVPCYIGKCAFIMWGVMFVVVRFVVMSSDDHGYSAYLTAMDRCPNHAAAARRRRRPGERGELENPVLRIC